MAEIICPSVLCCKQGTEDTKTNPRIGERLKMVKRSVLQLAFALLSLLIGSAAAQTTHTFTFGLFAKDSYTGMVTGSALMQTLDGNPANCGIGYCGTIEVPYNDSPYWGLIAPQGPVYYPGGTPCTVGGTGICSWGFPNNGFLTNNNTTPATLSSPTFIVQGCNLNTAGCIDYETGTSDFVGYGQGVTVSVTVWFKVNYHHYCGRGGCHAWYTNDETNGSGTATYTP